MKNSQEWLNSILHILNTVCEGIVPAGKPDEAIHWRTKELYGTVEKWMEVTHQVPNVAGDKSMAPDKFSATEKQEQLEMLLYQYSADGRALLHDLETDWNWKKMMSGNQKEVCYLLRRKYARQIAGSLQMLVNAVYLVDELENSLESRHLCEQIESLFEIDKRDEVKRVHAGVRIAGRDAIAFETYKKKGYRRAI